MLSCYARCNVTSILFVKNISCNDTLLPGTTRKTKCVLSLVGSLNPAIRNAKTHFDERFNVV